MRTSQITVLLSSITLIYSCNSLKNNAEEVKKEAVQNTELQTIDLNYMDRNIKPSEDFFLFSNGTWVANNPVPPSESRWGSFNELELNNKIKLTTILETFKNTDAQKGEDAFILGNYYASFMDMKTRNALGLSPIQADLDKLKNLKSKSEIISKICETNDFGISLANAKGQIDLMAKEFKLPTILRTSLALDKRLRNGLTFSAEAIFTKNLQEIYYQNVNFLPPVGMSVGPGSRNVYTFSGTPANIPMRSTGANPYTGVYILYNNPGKKGFSYNFSLSIDKAFRKGWSLNANWVYGNSVVNNETTSSQNNTQWNSIEVVNGRNFVTRSTSDFDLGHRFSGFASKKFNYAKNKLATTISLIYNGQQGAPFSYIYQNSMIGDNGRSAFGDLIYIPTTFELQSMIFLSNTVNGITYSQDQQRQLLDGYIRGNKYLRKYRGQFAARNGDRLPYSHTVDLKVQQDFNIKTAKKSYTIQISYNVSNFTNMLNRDWGRTYFLGFDQYSLIQFAGYVSAANLTPQYRFNPQQGKPWGVSTSSAPGLSARWISQLGIRLIF